MPIPVFAYLGCQLTSFSASLPSPSQNRGIRSSQVWDPVSRYINTLLSEAHKSKVLPPRTSLFCVDLESCHRQEPELLRLLPQPVVACPSVVCFRKGVPCPQGVHVGGLDMERLVTLARACHEG